MLDLKILNAGPHRWLCIECDAEGRGRTPSCCPCCSGEHWYESDCDGKDPRAMIEVLWDLMESIVTLRTSGRLH